jgi:exonuclease SbcC
MHLKLTVNNFRKFIKQEFVFDKFLTLISGKSGQGKSTIFMAIHFALTGEGKKLVTFGKLSCSVCLEFNDSTTNVKIIRTKKPNRLQVIKDNKTTEDDEAQAVLNQTFYQYENGYISQRLNKSFLLMSSLDKLAYIKNLAFGKNEDPNLILKHCKDLVKQRKDLLTQVQIGKKTNQQVLEQIGIERIDYSKYDSLFLTEDENKIEQKVKIQQDLILKQKSLFYKACDHNKRIEDLKDKLKCLESKVNISDTIEDVDATICKITTHFNEWNKYEKAKNNLKKLDKSKCQPINEQEIKDLQQILDYIGKIKIEQHSKNLKIIEEKISQSITKLQCPVCEFHVALWGDKLLRIENLSSNKFSQSVLSITEVKALETQKIKTLQLLEESKLNFQNMLNLCLKYPSLWDKQPCLYSIEEISSIVTSRKMFLKDLQEHVKKYNEQKKLCDSLKTEKPNYENNIETILKNKRTILYEICQIKKSLKTLTFYNISTIEQEIIRLESELEQIKQQSVIVKSFKHWSKVDDLTKEENLLQKSYPRSIKLQELVKTALKKSVCKIIEEINFFVQMYVDTFLDGFVVELEFENEKLNVILSQNGNKTDLNSLSGGEFARVLLAFTLAIAEVNNIKFLLIDEVTASLDQETTTQVMNTIKNNFKGMVLVIAHQTSTGLFDQVLHLEDK